MLHGEKQRGVTGRTRKTASIRGAAATNDDAAGTAALRAQWRASQADLAESVHILEALFQKFDVDPALASELGTAVTQLGEELLAAESDAPLPGSTAPVVVERDATRPHQSSGRGRAAKRPRDLN